MQLEILTQKPKSVPCPTPLLFIHGAWHGAWCWTEHFLPYFAQHGYESHALSLRGHGRNEDRNWLRQARISDYVADVVQVTKQLERPPVLIGHSMGGFVVQKYLEAHSAPAAILLASVHPKMLLSTTWKVALKHPLPFLKVKLITTVYPGAGTRNLTRDLFFSESMPEELVRIYANQMQGESYGAFLDTLSLNLPNHERIQVPILVLGAAGDAIYYPEEIEATARAYRAQVKVFPDMAHDMMLEANWMLVADYIMNWLGEHGIC